jgi:hypothetical protein
MKKDSSKRSTPSGKTVRVRAEKPAYELRPHYDFDYSTSRPNRFASKLTGGDAVAIVLDPDVATVFRSSEAVNAFLRSAISAMPQGTARKRRAS